MVVKVLELADKLPPAFSIAFIEDIEDARGSGALYQDSPHFRKVLSKRFARIIVAGQRVPNQAAVRVLSEKLVKYCT